MNHRPNAFLLLLLSTLLVALALPGFGEGETITLKLQNEIATLNAEQQAALLLLLGTMKSEPAVAPAPTADSARQALVDALAEFDIAKTGDNFDMEPFFARMSEDFEHWVVGDKAGARSWIETITSTLSKDVMSKIKFNLEDMEVDLDGDTAIAYPIDIDTPMGSATAEVTARLESDGVWRIIAVDGL